MKKIVMVLLTLTIGFGLVGCSSNEETTTKKETIKITTLNANKEKIELTVPYNPEKLAVLDIAALDIIDYLGLQDRVVGAATTSISYLEDYVDNKNVENLGTIKEVDIEAVAKVKPDIIFIGGRLSSSYDELSKIAPVIYISTDIEIGVVESTEENATMIASIFGKEGDIEETVKGYESRIKKLATFAEDKNAIISIVTSGSINILGNDGRCSIIGNEIGFNNIGVQGEESTSTHGNESSFELLLQLNPDYMFVLDRDSAIATQGAQLAKDIVENELVMKTNAYQNDNIVYLEHSSIWYTAEGGITALDYMLKDLESTLLKK